MKSNNASPFTHGMEIEQFPNALPRRARAYTMNNDVGTLTNWHDDASGPRETSIGPYKNGKNILNAWFRETRDEGITWDWHASQGGNGAGSHVHLCVAEDVFDDTLEAWTIAYNTAVELTPFFAPFWCHNWEDGFRDGSRYTGVGGTNDQLSVDRWASPTTTRFSRSSVHDRVENPRHYSRNYESVTFNPARSSGKPLTIELRLNDAHPSMALHGLLQLRRITGCAIEAGWSPKFENHNRTIEQCYDKIYERATEVGLLTAMQEPIEGGITFAEGRGIPGVDQREFDTMFEVLRAMQREYYVQAKTWRYRAQRLTTDGRDEYSPSNNPNALWEIDQDDFAWENGPTWGTDDDDASGRERESAVAANGGEN